MNQITEQDRDMLKLILEDIRGIRQRLDTHIEADSKSLRCVQRELSNIRGVPMPLQAMMTISAFCSCNCPSAS